ncbi:MAG: lipopolysaccharide biosynthesis protein [Bacteroidales bacterium]
MRRASASAAASTVAALVQVGVGLLVVPLALGYLGTDRYGLWMTVTSLTAMAAFADFGMGNGLLNAVAQADGRDDSLAIARAVSSAVVLLTVVAAVLGATFWISYPLVAWERIVNAAPPLVNEARLAVAIMLTCAVLSLPLGTAQRTQMGYQEGFVNSAWTAAGSVIGLVALLAAIRGHAALPVLVLALAGAPVVALAANALALFGWRRPAIRPRMRHVSRTTMAELLGSGLLFFAIQLAGTIGYQLPILAVARLLNPGAVTAFTVPLRLFMVMPGLVGFFLTPLWPAYREALARGDVPWVRRLVRKSIVIGLTLNVAWGLALVCFGPLILHWWVGGQVTAPLGLRLALCAWAAMTGLGGPFAMFLNAAGRLRFQAATAWLMATVSLGLCVVLIPALGVLGAPCAMVIAQASCIVVPTAIYVPRVLRGMHA